MIITVKLRVNKFFNHMKKKNSKKYFRNTFVVLLCSTMFFASCKKDEPKSAACEIMLFSVDGKTWDISGTNITRTYPSETVESPLTPAINISPGATINPPTGEAQNFFTEQGVTYTVTAEDGVTKKTYTAKATRTPYSECAIMSFTVDGAEWEINDSLITYVYSAETTETPLTPIITLSPGATVNPPSGEAKNFFTAEGVRYTVTSEDGEKTKAYIAKARRVNSECEILSFSAGGVEWTIDDTLITCIYSDRATQNMTPTIVLSRGATINPSASLPQDFFTEQGVIYTVISEDGTATKTYTAIATLRISGITGGCTWSFSDKDKTLIISGNGAMADYETEAPPWEQFMSSITNLIIEEGVTNVGNVAFYGHNGLTSVRISNSVITIGPNAFRDCKSLTSVTIGNSVTTIGDLAFYECSKLVSVDIPNSVTVIGDFAFVYCHALVSLTIGNSVTTIGEGAFFQCVALTSVTIPSSVTTIKRLAFAYCDHLFEVVNLSTTPQSIDYLVFENAHIENKTLKVPGGSVDAYKAAEGWKDFGNIIGI
jgi:hypothetical protein